MASHAVMSGENLPLVSGLLGHRRHQATTIYAHLDDNALRNAAAQAADVIAKAMGYETEEPRSPEKADRLDDDLAALLCGDPVDNAGWSKFSGSDENWM